MRTLRFVPLAAFAGVEGFAMFLPYLAFVGTAVLVTHWLKSRPQPAMAVA